MEHNRCPSGSAKSGTVPSTTDSSIVQYQPLSVLRIFTKGVAFYQTTSISNEISDHISRFNDLGKGSHSQPEGCAVSMSVSLVQNAMLDHIICH